MNSEPTQVLAGGIFDTLELGRDVAGIITCLLRVDSATDSATRLRNFVAAVTYIESKTQAKIVANLSNLIVCVAADPGGAAALSELLDNALAKK